MPTQGEDMKKNATIKESISELHDLMELTANKVVEVSDNLDVVKADMTILKIDVDDLKGTVANLPSKSYIDQKFATFGSDEQEKTWKHNQVLVNILTENETVTVSQVNSLKKGRFIKPR